MNSQDQLSFFSCFACMLFFPFILIVFAVSQFYHGRSETTAKCYACNGTGIVNVFVKSSDTSPAPERVGLVQEFKYLGYSYDKYCEKCDGAGKVTN